MSRKASKDKGVSWGKSFAIYRRAFWLMAERAPAAFVSTAICTVFSALSPYVNIYLAAQVIDELAGAREPGRLGSLVLWTVGVSAFLEIVNALLGRWRNRRTDGLYLAQTKVYTDKLLDMDYVDIDTQHTHDLLSQIDQASNWSNWGLGRIFGIYEQMIRSVLGILGAVALSVGLFARRIPEAGRLAFLNHPLCTAVILMMLLAVTFLSPMFANRANRYWSLNPESATFGNRVFSFFGFEITRQSRGLDMRIYRQEGFTGHYLRKYNSFGIHSDRARYARGPMGMLNFLSAACSSLFTGLVYLFVCLKAWAGAFGVGSVTQYVGAITALSGAVSGLVRTIGDMRANAPFMQTAFEFLDIPNRMYQGSLTTEKRADRKYEVEFKDVSFRYPGASDYALRHVSMKFTVGSRLAVVGQNGSGKTTFIKLLCRLYDPTEGEILLNGIDIRKYSYRDYQNIFSVVFQDFSLLSLPLGQNVAAGMEYDRDRVTQSLTDAGFAERLAGFPEGIDTSIYRELDEGGVQISGGEAQKIAIARALYKDAPFIILDEPTAALDPVAEAEIYEGFDRIVGDKTAIYISHRLSSCRFCDEIAVFDEGRVIQQGSHETLVADERGKYFELWNAQAQYYVSTRGISQ